jgi:hypothetical protein
MFQCYGRDEELLLHYCDESSPFVLYCTAYLTKLPETPKKKLVTSALDTSLQVVAAHTECLGWQRRKGTVLCCETCFSYSADAGKRPLGPCLTC